MSKSNDRSTAGTVHLRDAKATTAYLEPIRNALQKPVGGLPVLPVFSAKNLSQHKKTEGKRTEKPIVAYPKAHSK